MSYESVKSEPITTTPPSVSYILANYLKTKRRNWPEMFPRNHEDAAQFWVDHQEPPIEQRESPRRETNSKGVPVWVCPYHDRLMGSLRQFFELSRLHRVYVIDNIKRGVPYRGDDFEFYKTIVGETMRMKSDKPAYIEEALQKLKDFKFASPARP